MSGKNKVKFNICNVHYASLTVDDDGAATFGTPVAMPGAVSISMDPTGEPESFYADGVEYYVINNNQGYDDDLELAGSISYTYSNDYCGVRPALNLKYDEIHADTLQ